MRRYILIAILVALVPFVTRADEGMWLISKIESIYPQMKARGLIIDAKDIYNDTKPAIYKAVGWTIAGGTGSIIPDPGLL